MLFSRENYFIENLMYPVVFNAQIVFDISHSSHTQTQKHTLTHTHRNRKQDTLLTMQKMLKKKKISTIR